MDPRPLRQRVERPRNDRDGEEQGEQQAGGRDRDPRPDLRGSRRQRDVRQTEHHAQRCEESEDPIRFDRFEKREQHDERELRQRRPSQECVTRPNGAREHGEPNSGRVGNRLRGEESRERELPALFVAVQQCERPRHPAVAGVPREPRQTDDQTRQQGDGHAALPHLPPRRTECVGHDAEKQCDAEDPRQEHAPQRQSQQYPEDQLVASEGPRAEPERERPAHQVRSVRRGRAECERGEWRQGHGERCHRARPAVARNLDRARSQRERRDDAAQHEAQTNETRRVSEPRECGDRPSHSRRMVDVAESETPAPFPIVGFVAGHG